MGWREIKFNLDVPAPEITRRRYSFDRMPVGGSLAVPVGEGSVMAAANGHKRRHPGWNYTSRTVVEDGVRVTRVWRTA